MTVLELPTVHECAAAGCSYNHDTECHAGAINITGADGACGTFIDISVSGGLTSSVAMVGACHRQECSHNSDLECQADFIRVGPGADAADCLTFQVV